MEAKRLTVVYAFWPETILAGKHTIGKGISGGAEWYEFQLHSTSDEEV